MEKTSYPQPQSIDYINLITLGTIWASAFIAMRYLAFDIPALSVVFWRVFIAFVLLFCIVKAKGIALLPALKAYKLAAVYSMIGIVIPFFMLTMAAKTVNSSTSVLIASANPLVTIFLVHFLSSNEPISYQKTIGAVIGFIGISLSFANTAFQDSDSIIGMFMIAVAMLCYATSAIIVKKAYHIHPMAFTCVSAGFGVIPILIGISVLGLGFSDINIMNYDMNVVATLVYLGFMPTALAWTWKLQIVNKLGSSFLSYVGYIIPISGIILSFVLLSEPLSMVLLLSLCLVCLGIWISSQKRY